MLLVRQYNFILVAGEGVNLVDPFEWQVAIAPPNLARQQIPSARAVYAWVEARKKTAMRVLGRRPRRTVPGLAGGEEVGDI